MTLHKKIKNFHNCLHFFRKCLVYLQMTSQFRNFLNCLRHIHVDGVQDLCAYLHFYIFKVNFLQLNYIFTFFPATSLGLEFISDKRTSLILQNGTLETDIFDLIQFSMAHVNLKHNICHLKESI